MKRLATLFALTSLVACGEHGCGSSSAPDMPVQRRDAGRLTEAGTSTLDPGARDAGLSPRRQVTYHGKPQGAGFAPNGHVLFAAPSGHVLDWNLSDEPRDVDLGGEGVLSVHVTSGSSTFVVERAVGKDKGEGPSSRIELWDANRVTKLRDLEGIFEPSQRYAISRDRSRLLFGRCLYTPQTAGVLQCDGAVYRLPSGDLVHRTAFTSMDVQGYVPTMALSPTGRFVAAESQLAPSELRDSVTGNLALNVIDHSWGSLDESGVKLLWLDDTHVLHTAHQGQWFTVTNVVPPPAERSPAITLRVAQKDESGGYPRLSADRRRLATAAPLAGGTELIVWDMVTNESHRHPVPRAICIDDCELDWMDLESVAVFSRASPPLTSLRVHAITKEEKIEPFRPAPTYMAGGFSVLSTMTGSSSEVIAYARKRDNMPSSSIVVVTPSGARVDLGTEAEAASLAVQGDHILISTLKSTDVIEKSGDWVRFNND